MTKQKSFKRLVRSRMEKTGESYTAARAVLLAGSHAEDQGTPVLTVSDEAVRRGTGRGWEEWFDLVDAWGSADRPHPEIARWVATEHGVGGWWAQSVTVSYERARGLRAVGQRADGFAVGASKTVGVPVERLFEAVVDESMRQSWLPDGQLSPRTAKKPRSARFDWGDGSSRVYIDFNRERRGEEHRRDPARAAPRQHGGRADEGLLARACCGAEGDARTIASGTRSAGPSSPGGVRGRPLPE